jgi:hypothetical protein
MEDVWVEPVSASPPAWLTDANVRKGIRAILKLDRCLEERRRLGIEADNMCAWFGRELAALTVSIQSPKSKSRFTNLNVVLNSVIPPDSHIKFQLQQRCADVMRFQDLWQTPLVSTLRYHSHVTAAKLLATHLSGTLSDTQAPLTWLQPDFCALADTADYQLLEEITTDAEDVDKLEDDNAYTENITVDNIDAVLLAEALEETEELDVVRVACQMV